MATTVRRPLTTREDLELPQAPVAESGVRRWLQDFVAALKNSFRLHAHLFPAVIAGDLKPQTYKVATLPTAAQAGAGAMAHISDGAVGEKFRGSDGSSWLNLDSVAAAGGDNITVNGGSVTDADFDDATPAAPAGSVNVKWQKDASSPANISAYLDGALALGNNARVTARKNTGADVGTRRRLNFIEGSGVTLTVLDDVANEEVDVTVAAAGGGGNTLYARGTFSVADGNFDVMANHLQLTGAQRGTIAGTGRLRIGN